MASAEEKPLLYNIIRLIEFEPNLCKLLFDEKIPACNLNGYNIKKDDNGKVIWIDRLVIYVICKSKNVFIDIKNQLIADKFEQPPATRNRGYPTFRGDPLKMRTIIFNHTRRSFRRISETFELVAPPGTNQPLPALPPDDPKIDKTPLPKPIIPTSEFNFTIGQLKCPARTALDYKEQKYNKDDLNKWISLAAQHNLRIKILQANPKTAKSNSKSGNSVDRYELYKSSTTVGEFLAIPSPPGQPKNKIRSDFINDFKRGYITFPDNTVEN